MTWVAELDAITLRYGQDPPVLDELSLQIEAGRVLSLLGPSGSGKTTILKLFLGLLVPTSGEVRLRGQTVTRGDALLLPPSERALAVVFQDLALWPHMTVSANLEFALKARGVKKAERELRIAETLEDVGLQDKHSRRPAQLSGGERQRVAIARALVLKPDLVLMDEPLSNLDVGLQEELLHLFHTLFERYHTAALHITHDPWQVAALGPNMVVLDGGKVVAEGPVSDLDPGHESMFVQQICRRLGRL